jgi:hypothetical protein
LPHAPIAPAPQPLGQRVASPQPQRRAFFPATAAGKLLLVFIVFGSLALGFLAARYVVRSRRFPPFVAPVAAAPPSGSSMALSSSASSPVAAPAESAASPAQEPAPSTGAPPSASAPPPGLAPAEALVPAPAPAPASS